MFEGSLDEWGQEYLGCLRDEGWEASLGDPRDGLSLVTVVPPEQEAAFEASSQACIMAVGRFSLDESDDELRATYASRVEHYDCLVAAGFHADPPPSVEVYLDRDRNNVPTWDPMSGVAGDEYTDAIAACPRPVPAG